MNIDINKLTKEEVKILATLLNKLAEDDTPTKLPEPKNVVSEVTITPPEPKEEKLTIKENNKIRIQQRKPLAPSYEIISPIKQRKINEQLKGTRVCPICHERYKTNGKATKTCGNELCELIMKYDKLAEKHSSLRMKELAEEYEKRVDKKLIKDEYTEVNMMY